MSEEKDSGKWGQSSGGIQKKNKILNAQAYTLLHTECKSCPTGRCCAPPAAAAQTV